MQTPGGGGVLHFKSEAVPTPNVRAKPDPTGGRLAGAADDALHSRDGQVHGCWGSA